MVSSSHPAASRDLGDAAHSGDYFAERRARVDAFIETHFTWPGTARLHAVALGWDVLRAPLNAMLSPVLALVRMAAFLCRLVGLSRIAGWLAARRILLRTAVSGRVEDLIATDLLELPLGQGAMASDRDALVRAILAAPQLRKMIRSCEDAAQVHAVGQRSADALGEYAGTRSAVAEMTTGLVTLVAGALVFQALTPGMLSMAPGFADAVAQSTAISDFPMGQTIGGLWYSVFPTGASASLIAASVAILMIIGSVFAAFAGLLADPLQTRLGIHRRRLLRLIDTLETELCGPGDTPFVAREHYYARVLDVWDMVSSTLRFFRN